MSPCRPRPRRDPETNARASSAFAADDLADLLELLRHALIAEMMSLNTSAILPASPS